LNTIYLEPPSTVDLFYPNDNMEFAFCSRIKRERVSQITVFAKCREVLTGFIRTQLCGFDPNAIPWFYVRKRIDLLKVRMLVLKRYTPGTEINKALIFNNEVEFGIRILNLFEKKLKWTETKVYKVELIKELYTNAIPDLYMIEASKQWLFSPACFSLFLLLFRAGKYYRDLSVKDISSFLASIADKKMEEHLHYKKDQWLIFLKNTNRIYKKNIIERYRPENIIKRYRPERVYSNSKEGIFSMLSGTTVDKVSYKAWKNILDEQGKQDA